MRKPFKNIKNWLVQKKRERKLKRPKRNVIHKNKWRELKKELSKKLRNPKFFENLEKTFSVKSFTSEKVKRYSFKGKPVAIKDTQGFKKEGFNYKKFRKAILVHQKAIRGKVKGVEINAKNYKLVTPKVFGRIGNYLIMEYMNEMKTKRIFSESKSVVESFLNAQKQMKKNFDSLEELLPEYEAPQIAQYMVLGNTNPKKPEKGRWIFSLPYDFV